MSMWTGASDELAKYLAVREVERQRELADQIARDDRQLAREDRTYRRGRDVITDQRADEAAKLDALRQRQADEDRKTQLAANAKADRFRVATVQHETAQPGLPTGDRTAYDAQNEFGLAGDTFKKIALPVLKIARPSRPGEQPGDLATIATDATVAIPEAIQSLGGTRYQQQQREDALKQEFVRRGDRGAGCRGRGEPRRTRAPLPTRLAPTGATRRPSSRRRRRRASRANRRRPPNARCWRSSIARRGPIRS